MHIYHLLYSSQANEGLSQTVIDEILISSRKNNSILNISGLLLARGSFFIQLLEGEKQVVLKLYDLIKSDTRHHSVKTLLNFSSESRLFGSWDMGFVKDEIRAQAITEKLNAVLESKYEFDPNAMKLNVIKLFTEINKTEIS
jgi:hypothetical protein